MAYFRMRGPERRREGGTFGGGYPLGTNIGCLGPWILTEAGSASLIASRAWIESSDLNDGAPHVL